MPPTEGYINVNGLRLYIRDWGGPAKSPPILLVHGLASSARIWDLAAPLLASGRRTIALDQRGHGRSDKPDSGYDFATIAHDLAGAIETLGLKRPLLVGHSWGANVALHLAAEQPRLLTGVVLVDGGTTEWAATMSLEETLTRLAPPRLAGTPRETFLGRIRLRLPDDMQNPQVEAIYMANFSVDAEDRIAPHLSYENHMQIVRAMWEQRPTQLFGRVTCPALLIQVAPEILDDQTAQWMKLKRRHVEQAELLLPNNRIIWLNNTIHDISLHQPDVLARMILEFTYSLSR